MWKNKDNSGFRGWDVTKNDTLQHNQITHRKIGCAKQYSYAPANVTPKVKIYIEIFSPVVCQ